MAEEKNVFTKKVNLVPIIGSPVLDGKLTGQVWTGYPDAKYIDNAIIGNEKVKREFVSKVKDLEKSIEDLRSGKLDLVKRMEITKKIENLQKYLANLISQEQIVPDSFVIVLIKTYQEMKISNPKEINLISKSARDEIDEIEKYADSLRFIVSYEDKNNKRLEVMPIYTLNAERILKNDQFYSSMKKFLKRFYNFKEPSNDDIENFLNIQNQYIMFTDIYSFIGDENLASMILETSCTNFLIDNGMSYEEAIEIPQEEILSKTVTSDAYINNPISHSKIQTGYMLKYKEYINFESLMMVYAARRLMSLESVSVLDEGYEDIQVGEYLIDKENEKRVLSSNAENVLDIMKETNKFVKSVFQGGFLRSHSKTSIFSYGTNEEFTEEKLRKMANYFCGNTYLSPKMRYVFKLELLDDDELWNNSEFLNDFNFTKDELKFFIATDRKKSVILYNAGVVNKEFIIETLKEPIDYKVLEDFLETANIGESKKEKLRETNKADELNQKLSYLHDLNIISDDDIKNLYMEDFIDMQGIEDANTDFNKFADLITDEELISKYRNYVQAMFEYNKDKNDENKKKFDEATSEKNKFLGLYKKYKLGVLEQDERTRKSRRINFKLLCRC